jgi:anhydro-N-acetylmuramic acid kinase
VRPRAPARGARARATLGVGLMSGTSADGVDAALVEIRPRGPGGCRGVSVRTVATRFAPYPPAFRRRLLALPHVDAAEVARLDRDVGERLARATLSLLARAGRRASSVDFVASHGHTAVHLPARGGRGTTVQIGQPAIVAERTGIRTVGDFRPRDVAAGGEGAPLVPFADRLLLAREGRVVAAQNLGGIGNVACLGPGRRDLVAFDTGPGMMAIDAAAAHATGGRLRFDPSGRIARTGRVDEGLLAALLRHPFLRRRPPKSTGREEFGTGFSSPLLARASSSRAKRDLVATLTAFTAASVADAYRRFLPAVDEVVVSGGGARNATLLAEVARRLPGTTVVSSDARGVDPDFKEAVAFALLGWAHLAGIPNTCPEATGAARAVVAGAVWPAGARD